MAKKRSKVMRKVRRSAARVAAGGAGSAKIVGYGGALGALVSLARSNETLAEYLVRPYWQPVGLAIVGHVLRKRRKMARFGETALAVAGYQLGEQLTGGMVAPAPEQQAPADTQGINDFAFDAQGINDFAFDEGDIDQAPAVAAPVAAPVAPQLPEASAASVSVQDAAYMYY